MKKQYLFFLMALCVAFVIGCSESTFEDPIVEDGEEYFPLAIGHTWVYEVDSAVYISGGAEILQSTYQVKEEITDILYSAPQQYIITSSSRLTDSDPWIVKEVHTAGMDENNAFRVEQNRRFLKLAFPLREGKSWDGNIFFDSSEEIDVFGNPLRIYDGWEYETSILEETQEVKGQSYSNVIQINHIDREDKIVKSESFEQYAKDIGLISKTQIYLETQKCTDDDWTVKAEEGFITTYKLISFTK